MWLSCGILCELSSAKRDAKDRMKSHLILLLLLAWLLAACQPQANTDETLPTVAALPTETTTQADTSPGASDTPEPALTNTQAPTITASDEPPTTTASDEPTPTREGAASAQPADVTPTAEATITLPAPTATTASGQAVVVQPTSTEAASDIDTAASATAIVIEAARIVTLTPIPAGVQAPQRATLSSGAPITGADVVITEAQFQEEVDRLLSNLPSIQDVNVDFITGGIDVSVTALGGAAFTNGTFFVAFDVVQNEASANNFLRIQPVTPEQFRMVGGSSPSEAFVQAAYDDVMSGIFEAFDFILNERLGQGQHDLEDIRVDDSAMRVFLIVPVQ